MSRFYGVNERTDRFAVQSMRSAPPGLAGRDAARRAVFGAALEQFDQLLVAARAVGPAAAPIPLFYAFSQAARALAAARVDGATWQPRSHGLAVSDPPTALGATQLKPAKSTAGSLRLLCRSIDSPVLVGTVDLSSIWAATGYLSCVPGLGADRPPALRVGAVGGNGATSGILEGRIAEVPDGTSDLLALMTNRLAPYPSARAGLRVEPDRWPEQQFREPRIEVSWRGPDDSPRALEDVAPPPFPGPNTGHMLRPGLGPHDETLHPTAALYAALLALSSLCRYHPDAWRSALDRDTTPTAIAIEDALDLAGEMLPYIIRSFLEN